MTTTGHELTAHVKQQQAHESLCIHVASKLVQQQLNGSERLLSIARLVRLQITKSC